MSNPHEEFQALNKKVIDMSNREPEKPSSTGTMLAVGAVALVGVGCGLYYYVKKRKTPALVENPVS